uniref:hypothetical protein n=1 Tax=Clostridium sp. C8-1-8 TaxID=2698831 RepID=UPI001A9B8BCF
SGSVLCEKVGQKYLTIYNNTERVAFNNCSGDMFDLYDNTLIFRTLQNVNNKNYTLGVFDIVNQDIRTFKNDADLQIYKFYYNKVNNKIYTIERSISEMASTKFPNIPSNKVAEYDKSGENKKQIYSANKFIDNISVNNKADKLLFDATDIVNKKTIHSIYLIDLKNKYEKVILKPGDKFENTKFNIIKSPQFSPDEKGFYFLGSTLNSNIIDQSNKGNTVTSNALYYYEFSTSKISKIFEVDDAIINIFKVN